MIRVFIVAPSALGRAGLENLLAAHQIEVAGSFSSIDELTSQLSDLAVDAILIDSTGEKFEPFLDSVIGLGLASDFSVVLLGEGASPSASAEAVRAGISAVLPNDISPDQLVAALHAAASGLLVLHPAFVPAEVNNGFSAVSRASALEELAEPLTPRENEVLQMLASGLGNKEIAAKLAISDHTVKFHVASILSKLGAATRTEAVSIGIRRGLVLL
ncbi:MAG TPA: response regulator transcription factor [Candidatus Acidoferrum sp.]|nr:response regulator transcription factor [Candidatus Acidoferrum sp.]